MTLSRSEAQLDFRPNDEFLHCQAKDCLLMSLQGRDEV